MLHLNFSGIILIGYVLNIPLSILILFLERKNPAVTWAWLLAIMFLPYVGFIFYWLFGLGSRRYPEFTVKARKDEELFNRFVEEYAGFVEQQLNYISRKNILHLEGAEHLNDLVRLNLLTGSGAFSDNNKLALYHEGNAKFDALFNDIRNAKEFIHIQYYIVRSDDLGNRMIKALAEKAAQGVEVKFLVDGMGCHANRKSFYQPLTDAGGQVLKFLPSQLVRINYRNHRKICVIDGRIGYLGGFNIGDEYIGKVKKFGFWRDSHIRIEGDGVKSLELRFIMDWNFYAKESIMLYKKYFPDMEQREGVSLQIVSSGPDTKWPSVQQGYFKMMTEANRKIYIATPYFVPDDSIFEALRVAALSGIDVRVIIPAHPDHPFVYWASLSYLGQLLLAGVKCYQYEKGFIHSKLLLTDGMLSSIGTANMDVRSFKLNFETNAFIYDKGVTEEFEAEFLKDLGDCTQITDEWYAKRTFWMRVKETVSRMLSPLL